MKEGYQSKRLSWVRRCPAMPKVGRTALAAVIIHAMTPTHAHWGNRQYPPIAERLIAMIGGYSLPADSRFWLFTACLLIALMRQENRPLDIIANSNQEMVEILLDRLR